MTVGERLAQSTKKMQQVEHQKILQENREKEAKSKIDFRRKVIVGELFINHFPIVLRFLPSKTKAEIVNEFELLDNFLGALAQCYHLYQEMEDKLSQSH